MKKLFLMALAVMAALSFTSCNELINPSQNDSEGETLKTVHFYAVTADPQTKTVFGEKESNGYPTLWTTNKQVYLALAGVGGTAVRDAPVIPSADQKTAQFEAEIPQPPIKSEYVFKSISPSTAAAWTKADLPSAVSIPDEQTPTNASVDEDAQIMAAQSETFTSFPTSVNLEFSHVVAYGKFSLSNLPEGATVQSIEITAETPIAGEFFLDFAERTLTNPVNGRTKNTITIDPSSCTNGVYWFSLAPVDLQGQTLTFVVKTSTVDLTKVVTFPKGKGNFQAGQIASFSLDMTGTEPEKDPEFTLTGVISNNGSYELGDSHLLPAAGGTYTVNYSIANPGPLGERTRQVDYIGFYTDYGTWNQPLNGDKDVTVSPEHGTPVLNGEVVEGTITITVKPNTTGKDRRCRVCFVYWYQNDDGTYSKDYVWDNNGNLFIGQSAN